MSMAGRRFPCPADSALQVFPSDCKSAERWDKTPSCCSSPMLTNRQPIGIRGDPWESAKVQLALGPGAIVDRVLVGGARSSQTPSERPLVGMIEPFAGVRLGRRIQYARKLEISGLELATSLVEQVMRILRGVLSDRLRGLSLGIEHLSQRGAIQFVPRRFTPCRMRLDEYGVSALLRDADPGLHQTDGLDLAFAYGLQPLLVSSGVHPLDLFAL